ncbi:MAG: glycosyltransferase [Promethearchaeota archaeon]
MSIKRKKIWVFAFEFAGIAKVGGLGEVSANQCISLSVDPELDLEVFMPGHGCHKKLQKSHDFTPLLDKQGQPIILESFFDPSYFGIVIASGGDLMVPTLAKFQNLTSSNKFQVEIWHGIFKGVSMNLLVGKNEISARILNDSDVYGMDVLNAKLGLFSLAMKEYTRYCVHNSPKKNPDIIHIHDHHPLAALLSCKQTLNHTQHPIHSIITMHLLTWPRRELEFFWKSGVNNEPMKLHIGNSWKTLSLREVYSLCQYNPEDVPTLEKLGCVITDQVIAVSEHFLNSDIIPNCGGDLITGKVDFTWNGCDWDYNKNFQTVVDQVHEKLPDFQRANKEIHSWDLRKLFLTQLIQYPSDSNLRITPPELHQMISQAFSSTPYHADLTCDPFSEDGPMVLVTGRLSPQKGVETLFKAIPIVIDAIPKVKFIFLMIPTPYNLDELQDALDFAKKYPENVRFVFGIAGKIFLLAHLSADVYCCPSNWEPFGIVALEAMVSRIPVIASAVGGLQESIIDLKRDPINGTGILVPKEDHIQLGESLISLLTVMQISEQPDKLNEFRQNLIIPELRQQVLADLSYGEKIRDNALNRVENDFRWKKVSQKLKQIYLRFSINNEKRN